jgi:5-methylcytosine-specific restriction endonuclease McrA
MNRNRNTNTRGGSFSEDIKRAVWNKARIKPNHDPDNFRLDTCGAIIEWYQYGKVIEGGTGWEIDHIKPVALGGGDEISNLQPLQWQNNRYKGDKYPDNNYCIVQKKS